MTSPTETRKKLKTDYDSTVRGGAYDVAWDFIDSILQTKSDHIIDDNELNKFESALNEIRSKLPNGGLSPMRLAEDIENYLGEFVQKFLELQDANRKLKELVGVHNQSIEGRITHSGLEGRINEHTKRKEDALRWFEEQYSVLNIKFAEYIE